MQSADGQVPTAFAAEAAEPGVTMPANQVTVSSWSELQEALIAYFALRWLPQLPGKVLQVLALQAGAALAAFTAVYFLT